jgi:rSAM/selenodomain-associated transferase 1
MRRCLIIVGKEPLAGLAKTRLSAGIGAERAVRLYRCFLDDTAALASQLIHTQIAFSFWPESSAVFFSQLCPGALLLPQQGGDFGRRLLSAFEQASGLGYDAIVLIGSDNPGLPASYVTRAFDALLTHDVVLGPAADGGYYLIGMRRPHAALFQAGIAWSTASVAAQTCAAARDAGLRLALAPPWYDIDTADDLGRLYGDLRAGREGASAPATLRQLALLAADGLLE